MALKDIYDERYVADLGAAVQACHPPFDAQAFAGRVFDDGWADRELKARSQHIAACLHEGLPGDYREALAILRQAAPRVAHHGFPNLVFADYVEVYGLDDWEASMAALPQFNALVSAEFAVRPFIVHHPERTMAQMRDWARSDDPYLRRLASEGCRPRLPWGIRLAALVADPSPILPVLETLKDDPSDAVRLSVSNNLNDISKDHPQVTLQVLRRWQAHDTPQMRRLTAHALRSLLKAGDPQALELLGYSPDPAIEVQDLTAEPRAIQVGGKVTLSFDIISTGDGPQNLMIDYVVYLLRANGRHTPKVFKLSKRTIGPGEVLHIRRKVSFRPVTTRRYYPGEQALEPQINGRPCGRVTFSLL